MLRKAYLLLWLAWLFPLAQAAPSTSPGTLQFSSAAYIVDEMEGSGFCQEE
jgi:hypothetical protein